jgi:hypothetical protein
MMDGGRYVSQKSTSWFMKAHVEFWQDKQFKIRYKHYITYRKWNVNKYSEPFFILLKAKMFDKQERLF